MIVSNVGLPDSSTPNKRSPAADSVRLKSHPLDSNFVKRCRLEFIVYLGARADAIVDEILLQQAPQTTTALVTALAKRINDPRQAKQFQQRLLY